jgi:hypothetical protein
MGIRPAAWESSKMFDYLKGFFTAINLAFYYRGVTDRSYGDPAQMREALTKAATASIHSGLDDRSQERRAA